ncbi:MAG: cytochrome b/b6 domain-containing protein [Nitrospirae bacterium]|uniref:cytochrome b/b6 domain-containing protein n=1 Tax=Candidatus Magnetobacterium casense TaxID=1455061 RepID=UPI000698A09B|nr:cytochrome b/b6 domain-containing protein [Candidatus Magnetobacterium casensis]MBF0337349.1 cytochrome b/b6 domain-containing protein [Nitrospirota bacterium]
MKQSSGVTGNKSLGFPAILIHLGLVVFGISALLTGELADDDNEMQYTGFDLHMWLGIGVTVFVALRLVMGLLGPSNMRFSRWVPYTRARLRAVWEDIAGLMRFRLPHRPTHQGLAGVVQTFGILAFSWMALTGTAMIFFTESERGTAHMAEESHEVGLALIAVFLSLHVGAVIMNTLCGRHVWKKMLFLKEDTDNNVIPLGKRQTEGLNG